MDDADEYVTFESGGLTLEGRLHLPDGQSEAAVAVCHPHPQYGGDMNSNVVLAICRALSSRRTAALRFNFRGVGASEGKHSGGTHERDDAIAALDYLESRGFKRLALAGYSFGAMVALSAASDARLAAFAAVSLPVGFASLVAPEGTTPALLITGAADSIAPPEGIQAIAKRLGGRCRLEVVEGADHFWWGREDAMAVGVADFLTKNLRTDR